MNDHDLLIAIATDVKDIKQAIDGNGQPGLLHRVSVVETKITERERTALKAGGASAVIVTVTLGALWEWLKGKIGA